ncbi:hypothetical protein S245_037486 [Arachis hypogaea]
MDDTTNLICIYSPVPNRLKLRILSKYSLEMHLCEELPISPTSMQLLHLSIKYTKVPNPAPYLFRNPGEKVFYPIIEITDKINVKKNQGFQYINLIQKKKDEIKHLSSM